MQYVIRKDQERVLINDQFVWVDGFRIFVDYGNSGLRKQNEVPDFFESEKHAEIIVDFAHLRGELFRVLHDMEKLISIWGEIPELVRHRQIITAYNAKDAHINSSTLIDETSLDGGDVSFLFIGCGVLNPNKLDEVERLIASKKSS